MINQQNKLNENFKVRVLAKILITISISIMFFLFLISIGYIFYIQFDFVGNEPVYLIAQFVKHFIPFILILICLLSIIFVLASYLKKSFNYIDLLTDATNEIAINPDKIINLPKELQDAEEKINEVRMNLVKTIYLAKESEIRKNDLIIYLAHDLKTPLTSIIGYLTLLNDEKEISKDLQLKYLSIALNKSIRLEDLINEFFEISRFSLSNIELELTKINLNRMIEQIVYDFNPLLLEKHLSFNLELMDNMTIQCDIYKIERVFDNLIRNSINYSSRDSIIEIIAQKTINGIQLNFINEGVTLPKEKLDRIFEQFYRVDKSRNSQNGGSGLGLAIVKHIVELHKWSIKVYSNSGKTNFEIYIPNKL